MFDAAARYRRLLVPCSRELIENLEKNRSRFAIFFFTRDLARAKSTRVTTWPRANAVVQMPQLGIDASYVKETSLAGVPVDSGRREK